MKYLYKSKLITCFLDKDSAEKLADYLHRELNIHSAFFAHARGQCSSNHNAHSWKERDIIQVVVEANRADELFEKIFLYQELGQRANGFMFQEDLMLSSQFTPPEPPAASDPADHNENL